MRRWVEVAGWAVCIGCMLLTTNIFWNHVGVHDTAEIAWMVLGLSVTVGGYVFARAVGGIVRALKT